MDCFAEPVIGPRFVRTRWLAMTRKHRKRHTHRPHAEEPRFARRLEGCAPQRNRGPLGWPGDAKHRPGDANAGTTAEFDCERLRPLLQHRPKIRTRALRLGAGGVAGIDEAEIAV